MRVQTSAMVILGAVLVLVGWLWLREHDARVREAAAARYSQDSLAAAATTDRAEREARYAAKFLTYEAARRRAASELVAARRTADASAAGLTRLLDSLAAMAPDTLSAFVSRILADWTAHLDADLAERAAADAALAMRDARIVALEAAYGADLAAVNAQLDEALRQLARANARARPGLLRRALAALPWIAGGYVVGRVAR
jgi:hypothetical protein